MTLTFLDMFCGAGGSSIGYTAAGFRLVLGANHWERAIETHAANFPDAEHLCENINEIDMRRLPEADILHASPICTEISPAGGNPGKKQNGRKQVPGQLAIEEAGHVPKAAFERTRATFHDVIRATEVRRFKAVVVENVADVAWKWELFDWWVQGMCLLGYNVQYVSASSAHIWGEGNDPAPQWRDRLYLVFTRTGVRLPDVAPRPLARCESCDLDVEAMQWFKKPGARQVGKYRQQYLYRCPNRTCRHSVVEPYVRPAASIINWDELGDRIGDRESPLSANTMRRIQTGLDRFVQPVFATVAGNTYERPGSGYVRAWPAYTSPLNARTGSNSEALATPPLLVPSGGTWNETATSVNDPMRTRTVRDMEALVVPYYTKGTARPAGEPLGTLSTLDRFALATTRTVQIEDCRYRMLQPRENLRGQRFPDSYIVLGNQGEQTMQAGNAVSSNVTQWIGNALAAVL